jgi:hypothetical protein
MFIKFKSEEQGIRLKLTFISQSVVTSIANRPAPGKIEIKLDRGLMDDISGAALNDSRKRMQQNQLRDSPYVKY